MAQHEGSGARVSTVVHEGEEIKVGQWLNNLRKRWDTLPTEHLQAVTAAGLTPVTLKRASSSSPTVRVLAAAAVNVPPRPPSARATGPASRQSGTGSRSPRRRAACGRQRKRRPRISRPPRRAPCRCKALTA
jgi:hypothetical protein